MMRLDQLDHDDHDDEQAWVAPQPPPPPAARRYLTVPPRDQHRYAYMESFKLLLSDTAEAGMAAPLPAGCPHAREAVIGHYLAFMREHLFKQLRKVYGDSVMAVTPIHYCMTIPAGWSDSAKHLTRRWAPGAIGA
jgi:hypothetical protein